MYPQVQLPFSPDQLQRGFLQGIGPNNPPFIPPPGVIVGHPQVLQFVPAIAGYAAAEIQNTAESNPLRRFAFNMFSFNNFANDDFVALVQGAVDYLEVQLSRNPGLTVQAILEKTVLQTVEMITANMTTPWPVLYQWLNPQQQQVVQQQVQYFQNLKAATQQLRGAYAQPGFVQQQQMGGYPQGNMGVSRVDPRLSGGVQLAGGNMPSLFSNTPVVQPINPQGNSLATSRWSTATQIDPQQATPTPGVQTVSGHAGTGGAVHVSSQATIVPEIKQQPQQEAVVNTPTVEIRQENPLEPIYNTQLKWKRSDEMPYFPAFNPDKHNVYFQLTPVGSVIVRIKDPTDPKYMDYERHKIVSTFGAPIKPIEREQAYERAEAIKAGLKNIAIEREVRKNPPEEGTESPITFPTHVNPVFAVDLMEELIWLKTSCNWLESAQNGKKSDIYRRYGYVVDLVVGTESEDHIIETLRETRSWEGLWKVLNELQPQMSIPLWHQVNRRMTELVNRVLEFNLSLHDLTIDSYATDLPDLISYLRDHYGETILNAFKRNEGYLIHSVFETVPDEKSITDLEDFFLPDEDPDSEQDPTKKHPVFTHLIRACSFTFLNCLSHELKLEFGKQKSALLTASLTPVIYDIAKGIVNETNAVEETTFANHYIQTLDGRILEIDTGFLGEETYVIRLVK